MIDETINTAKTIDTTTHDDASDDTSPSETTTTLASALGDGGDRTQSKLSSVGACFSREENDSCCDSFAGTDGITSKETALIGADSYLTRHNKSLCADSNYNDGDTILKQTTLNGDDALLTQVNSDSRHKEDSQQNIVSPSTTLCNKKVGFYRGVIHHHWTRTKWKNLIRQMT